MNTIWVRHHKWLIALFIILIVLAYSGGWRHAWYMERYHVSSFEAFHALVGYNKMLGFLMVLVAFPTMTTSWKILRNQDVESRVRKALLILIFLLSVFVVFIIFPIFLLVSAGYGSFTMLG